MTTSPLPPSPSITPVTATPVQPQVDFTLHDIVYLTVFAASALLAVMVLHNEMLPDLLTETKDAQFNLVVHGTFTLFILLTLLHLFLLYHDLHIMERPNNPIKERLPAYIGTLRDRIIRAGIVIVLILFVGGELPIVEARNLYRDQQLVANACSRLQSTYIGGGNNDANKASETVKQILYNYGGKSLREMVFSGSCLLLFTLLSTWNILAQGTRNVSVKQWEWRFLVSDGLPILYWAWIVLYLWVHIPVGLFIALCLLTTAGYVSYLFKRIWKLEQRGWRISAQIVACVGLVAVGVHFWIEKM